MDISGVKDIINTGKGKAVIYRLSKLDEISPGTNSRLPYTIKILLESLLRNMDGKIITQEEVNLLAAWDPEKRPEREIPFIPARVVLQDFTGVPAIVDLAAMRSAMKRLGGDPSNINPVIPVDLVIDHSVQVDYHGTLYARKCNEKKEFERNGERYAVLRWGQKAFNNFRVVPPGRGIVHQVNLEYLASVVRLMELNGETLAYPDTLVGADSHTTMINGLGVLGWGVGGIEAEAVMLGRPYFMPVPEIIGFKLYGELKEGVTATDLVLTIANMLRKYGVVGKFVEFFGPGLDKLALPDRATISNMSPEFGATASFFPVDSETLRYLFITGRKKEEIDLVKAYTIEQGLFRSNKEPEPVFSATLELDMGDVEPGLAGPKRPQDRIPLNEMSKSFHEAMEKTFLKEKEIHDDPDFHRWLGEGGSFRDRHTPLKEIDSEILAKYEEKVPVTSGSIVIAAITSCTNTSNPAVLIGAGLLAKKAVQRGLKVKPYVKTSFAPGSRVVSDYLKVSGLLPYLEGLGFHVVGYGCTTCIGNSGPLPENVEKEVKDKDPVVASVLSGNRNYEGRINPLVKANYLASPPLVVAYAISGTVDIDLKSEPLGNDPNGLPVYLKDIWPKKEEIHELLKATLIPDMFRKQYSEVFTGTELWEGLSIPGGKLYEWDNDSTYIREPPFFLDFPVRSSKRGDIENARVLALLGETITTDHISPAGSIPADSPAGKYLNSMGVEKEDFNSYGSRRGNHEVMMRGTFGNIRLRNAIVKREGGWTLYLPTKEEMPIYDAAMRYKEKSIPLIVIAGKEYGSGSSRDWAAKGTCLLGVLAVIAESFERIHRSNLIGMGVLPLQFREGDNAGKLGLKGDEIFNITGIDAISPRKELNVIAKDKAGDRKEFKVVARLDSPVEVEYYNNGGILHTFLRNSIGRK